MIIKKNAQGYGYKYTDLAQIHKLLEENELSYQQYVEPHENGNDYIMTVLIDKEGKKSEPIRGCKIPESTLSGKSNPAQEYGSALTYARRYSLLMAYGLATTDDDAEILTVEKDKPSKPKKTEMSERKKLSLEVIDLAGKLGMDKNEVATKYKLNANTSANKLEQIRAELSKALGLEVTEE